MNANPIWLKSYPEGVPADIDPTQYSSLVGLLDDVLDFSRIEAGQVRIQEGPVEIDRLVHDLARRLEIDPAAEIIAAQADHRHEQTRIAEPTLFHVPAPPNERASCRTHAPGGRTRHGLRHGPTETPRRAC